MRNVYLEMGGRLHNFFETFIKNPPPGYRFSSRDYYKTMGISPGRIARIERLMYFPIRLGIPTKVVRSAVGYLSKPPPNTDLVMTNGLLDFRNEKWVATVEEAHSSFLGVYFDTKAFHRIVERTVESRNCRALICFNHAAANSMRSTYDCASFESKIVEVPPSVPLVKRRNRPRKNIVDLLFLGSTNFPSGLTTKGFHIAIKSFRRLAAKHENGRLTIREALPTEIRTLLQNEPKITLITNALDQDRFSDLMWSSDILLLPSLFTPWTSFLDAMNYELPIVTIASHANAELVHNEKWGLVSDSPTFLSSITGGYHIPSWQALKRLQYSWLHHSDGIVQDITNNLERLVIDSDFRMKLGARARKNLEPGGCFSIERMNTKLGEVLDHAIAE